MRHRVRPNQSGRRQVLLGAAVLALACSPNSPHSEQPGSAGYTGQAANSGSSNGGASGATAIPNAGAGAAPSGAGSAGVPATAGAGTQSGGAAGYAGSVGSAGSAGAPNTSASFPQLAKQYQGVFTTVPQGNDSDETPDAPLLGNGDLGVSMQNAIDTLTFILHKNEFWSLSEGRVNAMARLSLAIPGMAGASYAVTEDIGSAEVNGAFVSGGHTLASKSWVQADDTKHNSLFTEFTYTGSGTQDVTVSLTPGTDNTNPAPLGSADDVLYIDVRADGPDKVGNYDTRRVRVATRLVGGQGTVAANELKFTLAAGQSVTLATSVISYEDDPAYQQQAPAAVGSLTQADVDARLAQHHAWWDAFYAKSFVEIPNKVVEKEYYASLYLLASASRTGERPPGLWANWVMKNPAWNGDYTLNYNYETPFYAAFPTNHVELSDSYDKPVLDWLAQAQAEATSNSFSGAFYRVHIGPLPNGSGDTNTWNQKSCGAFAATDMLMHYYFTMDLAYAAKIYPALEQLSIFWQDYLKKDGDRYVIENDAQYEGDAYPQTNGVMSLGMVRFLLQGSIDISTALSMDASQRAIWQDRLAHLSAFPTFVRDGKTVFRFTEVGLDWNDSNAIGNQHIYPASQIGLGSDATLLQTAQNMISAMARWGDGNGTDTFYPAAARVGFDPASILTHLQGFIASNTYPNLHIHTCCGGIENLNTVPSTVAEMLLQSFQGKIRLFSDWPTGVDARFGDLRAYGAFRLSSDVRSDVVQYVRIVSERGGSCVLQSPWPSGSVRVYRNGVDAGTLSGATLTLPTAVNEVVHLAPDGASYQSILDKMSVPLASTN
jgi:alpha-L-fucosidase 2